MSWRYYPKPSPRPKALPGMSRKQYGEKWWSKQWLSALDSFGWSNRLPRGRSYARAGKVKQFNISHGSIKAVVQGSRKYDVDIELKTFSKKDWTKAIRKMSKKAVFSANLLNDEMPENIESVFENSNLSLIPSRPEDIRASCSCPDSANPCKHIAAVFYILADELDVNPFLLFEMRGMNKETVLKKLRKTRGNGKSKASKKKITKTVSKPSTAGFWECGNEIDEMDFSLNGPKTESVLLKIIGKPVFWNSKIRFEKDLCKFYKTISKKSKEMAIEKQDSEH